MICPACGEGFIEEISDAGSILPNPFEEDLMAARPNPPNNNEDLDTAVENELMELINGNDRGIESTPFSAMREDYSTD